MTLEDEVGDEYFSSLNEPADIKPNITLVRAESMAETKKRTMNQLLEKVNKVDFIQACESLGWIATTNKEGVDNPPNQNNYKVAIIDQLMLTAKHNNWYLALEPVYDLLARCFFQKKIIFKKILSVSLLSFINSYYFQY